MGLQELLLHLHPTFAFFFIPILIILGLITIPFIDGTILTPGRWCGSRRGIVLAVLACAVGMLLSLLIVMVDDLLLNSARSAIAFDWLSRGLIPLAAISLFLILGHLILRMKAGFSKSEAVMGGVMTVIGAGIGLTIIGIWFRGPGMSFVWPIIN